MKEVLKTMKKKNTKQEVQNTEENEEYDDDDDNYVDNKAEYGSINTPINIMKS